MDYKENLLDYARQGTGDRSVSWYFDGPQVNEKAGDVWGTRVRVWAWHDKDRKRFVCTVSVSEYTNKRGYTMESFDLYGQPRATILTAPVGRYSVGAFSQFLADVRAECQALAHYGDESTAGALLRKGAQLVNGTVTA